MACNNRHIEQRITELSKTGRQFCSPVRVSPAKTRCLKTLPKSCGLKKSSAEKYPRFALPAVQRRRNTSKRDALDFIKGSGE